MASFSDSLRSRSDAELVSLLLARPDLAVPAPGSLLSLAARATNRSSLERALSGLDAFALQVVETVVALAPRRPTDDGADSAPEPLTSARVKSAITGSQLKVVRAALNQLSDLALIWLDDDDAASASWQPAPGLAELVGPYPAGLGPVGLPPARPQGPDHAQMLADSEAPGTAAAPSVPALGSAKHLQLLNRAPAGAKQIVQALTWGPPVGRTPGSPAGVAATDWLVEHGFVTRSDSAHVFLPREVALALRKGRAFAASAHESPSPEGPELDVEQVDAQALGAVDESVYLVTELLNAWMSQSPAILRSGGLGVRDLRRLAADLDVDEPTAAFTVELAASAGLILDDAELTPHLTPTAVAHEWLAQDLAAKWARLVRGWWGSNRTPWLIGTRDARGALHATLSSELTRPWVARLRHSVVSVLADRPGVVLGAEQVLEVLAWRTPRAVPPANAVGELLAEAGRLGVVGAGALSSAGRALAADQDVEAALNAVLPRAVDEILLQGDLTGMVPGRPTAALSQLIDAAAVVESRGGALTVRFTDRSVTAALDAGFEGEVLLSQLEAHSRTGVPQPLEYLIHDAARRHGRLRVGSGGSYVRVEDSALLTGLVADPALRRLGLRALAPTVLIAQVPPAELLEVLRENGLAPVAEGADGALLDVDARRASAPAGARQRGAARGAPVVVESAAAREARVGALVTRLRAADDDAEAHDGGHVESGAYAGRSALTGAERRDARASDVGRGTSDPAAALTRLREAIDAKAEVWLEVIDGSGEPARRRVRPLRLESGRLRALDLTREAELTVAVHRIARVATSDPS